MNEQIPVLRDDKSTLETSIQHLFEFTKMNLIIGQMAGVFLQQAKNSIAAKSTSADPDTLAHTLRIFEEEYQTELPGLTTSVTDLYKTVFTEDDVEAILAFYRSEVGRKFLQGGAQIEQQLQPTTQLWAQNAGKAAFERAITRVENK